MGFPDIGRNIVINIDLNGVGGTGANWSEIGHQKDGGLSRKTDTADTTNKQDNGWPSAVGIRTPWSISVGGLLDQSDPGWVALKQAWLNKSPVYIQIDRHRVGGDNEEGAALIDSLDESFPEPEAVSYKAELKGNGPLSQSP